MPKAESSIFRYMAIGFLLNPALCPSLSGEMNFVIKICLAYSLFNSSISTLLY